MHYHRLFEKFDYRIWNHLSVYQIRGAHLSSFLVCRSSLVYRWIESLPFGVNIVGEEVPGAADKAASQMR